MSNYDLCTCPHVRAGHKNDGKGKCMIRDCKCKKFVERATEKKG